MKIWKTEAGHQAFKARSSLISSRQRAIFILVDGHKSIDQVLAFAVGLGANREDIDHLVEQGFVAKVPALQAATLARTPTPVDFEIEPDEASLWAVVVRTQQERYLAAMPIATRLTAALGLRGFRLNLAVEAASGFEGLMTLLPKIRDAVGVQACMDLERALLD